MQDITITALVQIALAVNLGALCAIGTFLFMARITRFMRSHSIVNHDTLEALGFERYAQATNAPSLTFDWPSAPEPVQVPEEAIARPIVVTRSGKPDMRYKANHQFGMMAKE